MSEVSRPAPDTPTPDKPATSESVRETIESILIAFILAFVFRAFVVEAFVIPTGSMATTLMGAHMRFRCADCGHPFTANYSGGGEELDIDNVTPPNTTLAVHCDNCGYKVPKAQARQVPIYYGDRILVLKYLYLLQSPQRWDVVVFKSPTDQDEERRRIGRRPTGSQFSDNFIKRLVGLPGEQLMLLDGDVYVLPPGAAAARSSQEIASAPWTIQTKSRVAQDALWRLVYDNDYRPQRDTWKQPWQQVAGAGWNTQGRLFSYSGSGGSGTLAFNPQPRETPQTAWYPLTDWLPYNETRQQSPPGNYFDRVRYSVYSDQMANELHVPRWNVSDLKLSLYYQRRAGQGALRLSLTKLGVTFTAEIYPDHARLLKGQRQIGPNQPLPAGDQPLRVELVNADYRVSLRLNGVEQLATAPADYSPNVPDLLRRYHQQQQAMDMESYRAAFEEPRIEISAQDQSCTLAHVGLWRDIYYTPSGEYPLPGLRGDGPYRGTPTNPVHLGRKGQRAHDDDEFFVLGDNSILSSDARAWHEQTTAVDLAASQDLRVDAGRVPGRFMIGKAFFVYWPAGYRPLGPSGGPGLIPNFGQMRFIH